MKEYFLPTSTSKTKASAATHGWDSPTFRGPPSRKHARGFESHAGAPQELPPLRQENEKGPMRGPFHFLGGEGGIRTHGTVTRTPDFESGTFDHSATSPESVLRSLVSERQHYSGALAKTEELFKTCSSIALQAPGAKRSRPPI
ncbi:hypothetical protein MASSI9I_10204 [Massilia sp. 9I]|nr:hypothetical protein MASSI9I_10204 [Massilia sp. 9I]